MKIYFVTGGSGAVGSAVVPRLLDDPESVVYLLLRAESPQRLDERLEGLFGFWGVGAGDEGARGRIRALRGDVTSPLLGLEQSEYDRLVASCTHIIHCAGQVRLNLPLEEARRQAVDSARNVLSFGAAGRERGGLQKIELVSTVGVVGYGRRVLEETWLSDRRRFHNTYEAAKAEAEVYVASMVAEGLPITVHRPSMVVGDSSTGRIIHFQVFYHLCEFLTGSRSWGLCPRLGESRLDIIPVDYVASALVWSSQRGDTVGRILHLCSGIEGAIRLTELRDRVREAFSQAGRQVSRTTDVPPRVFRAALPGLSLLAPAKRRRALRALPMFLDYLQDDQVFANARTRQLLDAAAIRVPHVPEYLGRVLGYYLMCSQSS